MGQIAHRFLGRLLRTLFSQDVFIHAGAIAYMSLLSLFPLLVGLTVFLSRFVDQAEAQGAVTAALEPYLPAQALRLVGETVTAVVRVRLAAGTLAVVGALLSGMAVASMIRLGLNRILRLPPGRPFWPRKLTELAMVLLGALFLSLSLIVSTLAAVLQRIPPLSEVAVSIRQSAMLGVLVAVAPCLFSAMAFLLVYRFLPDTRVRTRSLFAGSLAGLVLFEVSRRAFFWYVGTLATYPLIYGPLAGLVVFVVWVYLVAVVVLAGAAVMALLERAPDGVPRDARPGR